MKLIICTFMVCSAYVMGVAMPQLILLERERVAGEFVREMKDAATRPKLETDRL